MGWREQAACRDMNPDMWFTDEADTTAAKTICESCEVRAECLDYAVTEKQDVGVWGGLTARERLKLRRAPRKSRPELRMAAR